MSVHGTLGAIRKAIRRRFMRQGIVLMYHRISSGLADPWRLCVSPANFDQQLQVLRESCRPVSLDQLAGRRGIEDGMVAVTFDDGYADNLHTALPLLEQHEIPATFFLTSGTLGAHREFWWDELERLLLRRQRLPSTLHVRTDAAIRAFETGTAAEPFGGSPQEIMAAQPWDAAPGSRVGFYYVVWQCLRELSEELRRGALADIRDQLQEADTARDSHRLLTRNEAIRLAAGSRIDIGAHSVTHAALSTLSLEAQRREIGQSKVDLEALLNRPVHGFAYPYGDYARTTPALARETGFHFACTTAPGSVTKVADPFHLPRIPVPDCSGAEFRHYLEKAV